MGGIPPAEPVNEISSDIFKYTPPRNKFAKQIYTRLSRLNYEVIYYATPSMFYYVYILKSLKNGSLYIGYTTNLRERVKKHNNGENLATKPFRPYKLIFYEAFLNRIDAKNREEYLKSGYGRRTIKSMLKQLFNLKR